MKGISINYTRNEPTKQKGRTHARMGKKSFQTDFMQLENVHNLHLFRFYCYICVFVIVISLDELTNDNGNNSR